MNIDAKNTKIDTEFYKNINIEKVKNVENSITKYNVLLNNLNIAHTALTNLLESKFVDKDISDIITAFKYSYDVFYEAITVVLQDKKDLIYTSAIFNIAQQYGLICNATLWKIIANKRDIVMNVNAHHLFKVIDEIKDVIPLIDDEILLLIKRLKQN